VSAEGQEATDLDLSVAFYDRDWRYAGVCSFYMLKFNDVAKSAGDLRDAPWPDGATEFIDIDRNAARAAGVRYAVMVVNNYAGLPFSLLERGLAGLMLRDDLLGTHFDPRTVELRFDITGENGVYLPLVFDIEEGTLHWLDVQARGDLAMNNVETSKSAIARLCPELIAYFASGTRMSMYELSLLHAASRGRRVPLRGGDSIAEFVRRESEDAATFLARLRSGASDARHASMPPLDSPLLAMLFHGDLDLPADASVYALFREPVTPTFGASDLSS
jgi:hypothetical protein